MGFNSAFKGLIWRGINLAIEKWAKSWDSQGLELTQCWRILLTYSGSSISAYSAQCRLHCLDINPLLFFLSYTLYSLLPLYVFLSDFSTLVGRNSSVGVANCYVLYCPEIESRCGRDFLHPSRPSLRSTLPPIEWAPSLYSNRVWCWLPPHFAPRLKEE